jgi:IclR family transcriptional regulator, pca regulon regulatory protein
MAEDSRNFIESLSRGFIILSVLSESKAPLSLTEIAREAGLSRSTVQRFVYTMESLGLLVRNDTDKAFRLGPKMISMALYIAQNLDVNKVALPYMREAASETGESVGLGLLSGKEIIYANVVKTRHLLSIEMRIGDRFPVYCTSLGRVFLASLPETQMETILETTELKPLTPHTITEKARLRAELDRVRQQGFSVNDQETHLGLRSVAAPVRSALGEVIAAVNIIAPTIRASREDIEATLALRIMETAAKVSEVMGYRSQGKATAYSLIRGS